LNFFSPSFSPPQKIFHPLPFFPRNHTLTLPLQNCPSLPFFFHNTEKPERTSPALPFSPFLGSFFLLSLGARPPSFPSTKKKCEARSSPFLFCDSPLFPFFFFPQKIKHYVAQFFQFTLCVSRSHARLRCPPVFLSFLCEIRPSPPRASMFKLSLHLVLRST